MQLITTPNNIKYLTGFSGSYGFLLFDGKKATLFSDFRYKLHAQNLAKKDAERVSFEFIETDSNWKEKFEKIVNSENQNTPNAVVEFEQSHMSVQSLKKWKSLFKNLRFTPIKSAKNTIEFKRKIKDEFELSAIHASQKINEACLLQLKKYIKPGVSELELAWKIKIIAHDLGADDISFEPIVAFGENSASPHHKNTEKKLNHTDIVLIDMGVKLDDYCSDMTRTFLPKNANQEQKNVYKMVLDAQMYAIYNIKSGAKVSDIDAMARKQMGEYSDLFGHSLGHGIGLDVHEMPSVSTNSKEKLEKNMVITVEPGIYIPGKFGVRIEDMGRVMENSYQNFTEFPK